MERFVRARRIRDVKDLHTCASLARQPLGLEHKTEALNISELVDFALTSALIAGLRFVVLTLDAALAFALLARLPLALSVDRGLLHEPGEAAALGDESLRVPDFVEGTLNHEEVHTIALHQVDERFARLSCGRLEQGLLCQPDQDLVTTQEEQTGDLLPLVRRFHLPALR